MTEMAPVLPTTLEKVLLAGDLSGLSEGERLVYYRAVCESLGLNPLTVPSRSLERVRIETATST